VLVGGVTLKFEFAVLATGSDGVVVVVAVRVYV
jgi:hypothetical protein